MCKNLRAYVDVRYCTISRDRIVECESRALLRDRHTIFVDMKFLVMRVKENTICKYPLTVLPR
jgi:hypothetical protein